MSYFFTSDHHFNHFNIIRYCERPFASVEEMNEVFIHNWNRVVTDKDIVWHIGDFAFGGNSKESADSIRSIFYRLKGQKNICWGNHDLKGPAKKVMRTLPWGWYGDLKEIIVDKQKIFMCHYAFKVWASSHRGSWNLHGHSHGNLFNDPYAHQMDVGVDSNNYTPVSFDEIKAHMATKKFRPVDSHKEREKRA